MMIDTLQVRTLVAPVTNSMAKIIVKTCVGSRWGELRGSWRRGCAVELISLRLSKQRGVGGGCFDSFFYSQIRSLEVRFFFLFHADTPTPPLTNKKNDNTEN